MWSQGESPNTNASTTGGGRPPEPKEAQLANLGRSVFVKGDVTGSEDLTVDGRVEGRIDLPDYTLTIGPNASIRANITAKTVTVFGSVVGNITAREKVEVRRGGSLEGDLTCARIAIQDGAYVSGIVDTNSQSKKERRPVGPAALAPVA